MNFRILILLLLAAPAWGQQKASVSNLRSVVEVLAADSLRGRSYKSDELVIAQRYIVEQYKRVGLKPLGSSYLHSVEWHDQYDGNQKVTNIIGVIEGSDPALKDEYIVVGAHYDHVGYSIGKDTVIYNGADDNASGVSGIIELASIILAGGDRPSRSILMVAFDAEEAGLIGSSKFVKSPPIPIKSIKAMLSVDMIGHANLIRGLEISGVGSLKGISIPQSLFTSSDSLEVKLRRNPSYMIHHTDTSPFLQKHIADFYVNTGLKANYHKPTDDASTLDYPGMAFAVDNLKPLVLFLTNQSNICYTNPIPRLAIGVTAGAGYNRFMLTDGPLDNKSSFTYSAGLSFLFRLQSKTAIQADVLYKSKTSRSEMGRIFMPSLHIPIHLMVISPYKTIRMFTGVGPYYSHSFERYVGGDKLKLSNSERDDYGMSIKVGFIVMNYQLALSSCYGFKRLVDNQPLTHYRSVEASFTYYLRY